jgi:hypothetical protein
MADNPMIYGLIQKAMGKIGAIGKDSVNEQQKFKYRGIDAVYNALNPVMSELGLFICPEIIDHKREERRKIKEYGGKQQESVLLYSILTIKYTMYAPDGSNVSCVVVGEGMDSGDKASNKAMAVGMKYALFQVFCIPTEEMVDPDSETPPDSDPIHYCEDCTQAIQPVKMKDGAVCSPKQFAAYTADQFGRQLCRECYKKAQAAKKAAEGA